MHVVLSQAAVHWPRVAPLPTLPRDEAEFAARSGLPAAVMVGLNRLLE